MKKTLLILYTLLSSPLVMCQQSNTIKTDTVAAVKTQPATEAVKPNKARKDTRPLKERIAFGFGSSFWITPSQTYIEVAPVLAYRFPKRLITGLGYRYIYRHNRVGGENLNAYGPNIFARLDLLKRVYFWTEYEILHNEYATQILGQELGKSTITTDSWFAGLGYIRSVGKKGRGGISIQLLYNILYYEDDNSPYYSPVTYRVGYYF